MSSATPPLVPHPLRATAVALNSPDFKLVQGWAFPDAPFYFRQVGQMLVRDVPLMMLFRGCKFFVYRDLSVNRDIVGFGAIYVDTGYCKYCNNLAHPYIPVLSVKPGIQSFGYGQSIVQHLVAASRQFTTWPNISDLLFLDVYVANAKACNLYANKCGFRLMNQQSPMPDPDMNNEEYLIMSRKV